jgi:hypothetical protein
MLNSLNNMTMAVNGTQSFGLSSRQANYVKKLGQISGRDILPIDLDLYRELMKLGLIIDKGRRLALTELGKKIAADLP